MTQTSVDDLNYRHRTSLGALLTRLSLDFEFFSQQILGQIYVDIDGPVGVYAGAIPRTEIYDTSFLSSGRIRYSGPRLAHVSNIWG